jgi:hypothetical protein
MYVGICTKLPNNMAKLMKKEMFIVGDIRELSKFSEEIYLVRSINGQPKSSVKEGIFYNANELIVDGPVNITDINTIKTLIDLGIICHENDKGDYDLIYRLAKNNALSTLTSKFLFKDAKEKGINYDIEKLRSEAGSFISMLNVYTANQ